MKKQILALALALSLGTALTACGTSPAPAASTPAETVTLNVAASSTPHAQILNQVKDVLAAQGIDLQVHEYGDYVVPNTAVEEGEEDANYFQHTPYLESFNAKEGTHLVSVAPVHYEPMGIYAGKTASLDALADGASIAIPNDPTNEGRALLLLEAQGLIKLDEAAGLEATPSDIAENPKNLQFSEQEAAMLSTTMTETDLSVINANYALEAKLDPVNDPIVVESADGTPYPNVLVVKEGHEQDPAILALVEALHSDAVRDYINDTFKGAVVPLF